VEGVGKWQHAGPIEINKISNRNIEATPVGWLVGWLFGGCIVAKAGKERWRLGQVAVTKSLPCQRP